MEDHPPGQAAALAQEGLGWKGHSHPLGKYSGRPFCISKYSLFSLNHSHTQEDNCIHQKLSANENRGRQAQLIVFLRALLEAALGRRLSSAHAVTTKRNKCN